MNTPLSLIFLFITGELYRIRFLACESLVKRFTGSSNILPRTLPPFSNSSTSPTLSSCCTHPRRSQAFSVPQPRWRPRFQRALTERLCRQRFSLSEEQCFAVRVKAWSQFQIVGCSSQSITCHPSGIAVERTAN